MNFNQQSILSVASDLEETGQRMLDISEEIQVATSATEIADAVQRLTYQIDVLNTLKFNSFGRMSANNSDTRLVSSTGGRF